MERERCTGEGRGMLLEPKIAMHPTRNWCQGVPKMPSRIPCRPLVLRLCHVQPGDLLIQTEVRTLMQPGKPSVLFPVHSRGLSGLVTVTAETELSHPVRWMGQRTTLPALWSYLNWLLLLWGAGAAVIFRISCKELPVTWRSRSVRPDKQPRDGQTPGTEAGVLRVTAAYPRGPGMRVTC